MISETVWTVQAHGVHTAFLEMTSGLSHQSQVDLKVNTFRKSDIKHIQTIGPYALLQLITGRGKKVISVHVIPDSFVGSLAGGEAFYNLAVVYLRFFYNRGDRLLAVSEEVKTQLINQLGIRKPIDIVFNTVNTRDFVLTPEKRRSARAKLNIKNDEFVIIGNGQIQPRKRFDTFVKLAREAPSLRFIWVGGIPFKQLGADYKTMQKLIAEAPANLTATGVLERSEVVKFFHAGDAFLLPSDQENHPMAIIEAAAAGLPVIVRDLPDYDSAFGNDVLRGTDKSFLEIIEKLKNDPEFQMQAERKAYNIAQRFDNSNGSQRLIDLYRTTIAS